jgi:hypothetical protein
LTTNVKRIEDLSDSISYGGSATIAKINEDAEKRKKAQTEKIKLNKTSFV